MRVSSATLVAGISYSFQVNSGVSFQEPFFWKMFCHKCHTHIFYPDAYPRGRQGLVGAYTSLCMIRGSIHTIFGFDDVLHAALVCFHIQIYRRRLGI